VCKTGKKEMFFNALRSKPSQPRVRPIEEQEDRESQKLWAKTAQAVRDVDHSLATEEKTKIEDMQRDEAARRVNEGVEWHPRLFRRAKGGPGAPDEGLEELEWIINAQMYGSFQASMPITDRALTYLLIVMETTQKRRGSRSWPSIPS
jgi:hypothetical protein